jgi:hypothetical protein
MKAFLRTLAPISATVLALTCQTACSSDGDDEGAGGKGNGGSGGSNGGSAGTGGSTTGGSAGNATGGTAGSSGGTGGSGGGDSDCNPPCTGDDICTICRGPDGDDVFACIPPDISCSP